LASVSITPRMTRTGQERYHVRYRKGGRESTQHHAGSFGTLAEAEACRAELRKTLATFIPMTKITDRKHVYFARLGDLIKIGISVNPAQRCQQLNADLLRTEPGGRRREIDLHNVFQEWRVSGEWFHAAPPILSYIEHSKIAPGVVPVWHETATSTR
jgi:hypothetical protein